MRCFKEAWWVLQDLWAITFATFRCFAIFAFLLDKLSVCLKILSNLQFNRTVFLIFVLFLFEICFSCIWSWPKGRDSLCVSLYKYIFTRTLSSFINRISLFGGWIRHKKIVFQFEGGGSLCRYYFEIVNLVRVHLLIITVALD